MADNTELNPGEGGDIAAADDIGGVKYQRVKLTLGADGVDDGDLSSSNPMPVQLAGAAQDATVQALNTLNDTMLVLLAAILEKMPRVTGNDQVATSIETIPAISIAANQDLRNITGALANITSIGGKPASTTADALAMAGTQHIYSNIIVSA